MLAGVGATLAIVCTAPGDVSGRVGMANFGFIDFDHLTFPAVMRVDWVGCNPPDFPTADYINQYLEAYTNANLTTWVDDFRQVIPKNRLADTC
ncbi:hypothetical protein B0H14DRAFT_3428340 [Mycena olivaceomarginata]|nr:hypothetical protein B0H14DRAFT_3428340 [Mycena olivaceomarginata]